MVPPRVMGTITNISEAGSYTVDVSTPFLLINAIQHLTVFPTRSLGRGLRGRIRRKDNRTQNDACLACSSS
jgi:hypothetical protein